METLGNRIQKLREENNLNKEQFGKSIGITGTGLNNYEKDLRSPSADIIARICEVYGVSADYLLFGVSAENRNICEVTGLSQNSINVLEKWNTRKKEQYEQNFIGGYYNAFECLEELFDSENIWENDTLNHYGLNLLDSIQRYIKLDFEQEKEQIINNILKQEKPSINPNQITYKLIETSYKNTILELIEELRKKYN